MENKYGGNNKWEEEMECEESGQSGIVYGEASSDSLNQGVSYVGDSGKEVGNNCCPSE